MAWRDSGPRRSESVDFYPRETRLIAVVALLAIVGGVVSDTVAPHFWVHRSLIASLVANVIIVMLTVAVINEAVERRKRRRWRVLAQYVMLKLVRDARLVWTEVAEFAGLMPPDLPLAASIDEGARMIRDSPRLTVAIGELVGDVRRRRQLHDEIPSLVEHIDHVLGTLGRGDAQRRRVRRGNRPNVELAGDLAWLGSVLDHADPDHRGDRRAGQSHPVLRAAQVLGFRIEREVDGRQLADRLVAITQIAERLDRGTLELALRIVPIEWWAARLGTTPATAGIDPEPAGGERVDDISWGASNDVTA